MNNTQPTALGHLLDTYRTAAASEREKGTYFEELIVCYLRNEATYRDLYSDVWTYAEWAQLQGLDKRDAGIDLVARVQGISWTRALKNDLAKNRSFEYLPTCLTPSLYRPFTKQWMYFNRTVCCTRPTTESATPTT